MFMTLIVAVVSLVYTYLQIQQVVYIKYVQFFICQSYLNRVVLNKKIETREINFHNIFYLTQSIGNFQIVNNIKIMNKIIYNVLKIIFTILVSL